MRAYVGRIKLLLLNPQVANISALRYLPFLPLLLSTAGLK